MAKQLTEKRIREIVHEVSIETAEHVINTIQGMFEEQDKKNAKTFATKKDIVRLESKLDKGHQKIEDNRVLVENRVTRREFEELKKRVNKYHFN